MGKYTGVCWHKTKKIFRVKVKLGERDVHCGYFHDEEEAARVYDCAVLLLKGDAPINFDGEPPADMPKAAIIDMLLSKEGIEYDQLYT